MQRKSFIGLLKKAKELASPSNGNLNFGAIFHHYRSASAFVVLEHSIDINQMRVMNPEKLIFGQGKFVLFDVSRSNDFFFFCGMDASICSIGFASNDILH
jgi:hypothetical protein